MLEGFKANGIDYYNKYGTLVDRHTISLKDADGNVETKTAKYILLSAGGRPNKGPTTPASPPGGGFPGADLCISSDDLFWLQEAPGKTLVVGAAYIALECAGFLTAMGYDTTITVRSMLLRGFDRESVDRIGDYMAAHGAHFEMGAEPTRFEPGTERKVRCYYMQNGEEKHEEYDTVLLAIGRNGEAAKLGLENAGVWTNGSKVDAPCERTNVPNIFCIGDLVANRLELTPVAKVAGKKVVKRLFGGKLGAMDYTGVATTVFTPLEYGMVGMTSEQATEKFGPDGFTSITKEAKPLEWALTPERDNAANKAFFKVLVNNGNDKIIGFHYLGPHAGEILQGVAVAIKAGAKKEHLDDTIGIHPTTAETM